ncbi:RNA-guided endonuclease InsQ/TnpB family protein [Lentzea flaviverrucosa]|uniref:Putative transposase n=1 Tax=Lentzea flaviverrucosa TaxID=200379 RepID=A0A1H9LX37_9PSEU|nr:RNA-guided endonuclease TnpB family protein [Lentzea flaviverrucosa]RDI31154.1 putative transposase [Lentzea flaviverrucosa]SER16042.1 putative transposase [Lentzea flaviverrucosa]
MRTAYKCRAYPTPEKAAVLSRTLGCVRLVWNKTLSERTRRYHTENAPTSHRGTSATLTTRRRGEELAFLSEVSCVPLQQTLRHQQAAFQNFFSGRTRYPRFKSRTARQSAHHTRSAFRMRDGSLVLAKTSSPLRFIWSFSHIDVTELDPTTVIASREPDGPWYVSFAMDVPKPAVPQPTSRAIGLDLGLATFLTTSDSVRIATPRNLARKARSLARHQRGLARCQRGSNNRHKAKAEVARTHRKVRNARRDFLHRTSTALVRSADMVAVEDLNVAGTVRNRRLSRAISDAGRGEFRRQLEYKCERAGRTLVVIDRWYPSSKTCSNCEYLLVESKLSARHWTCPSCRTRRDRDFNAAKNILAAGRAVARDAPGDACGADVRRQGSPLPRSVVEQEARGRSSGS